MIIDTDKLKLNLKNRIDTLRKISIVGTDNDRAILDRIANLIELECAVSEVEQAYDIYVIGEK